MDLHNKFLRRQVHLQLFPTIHRSGVSVIWIMDTCFSRYVMFFCACFDLTHRRVLEPILAAHNLSLLCAKCQGVFAQLWEKLPGKCLWVLSGKKDSEFWMPSPKVDFRIQDSKWPGNM